MSLWALVWSVSSLPETAGVEREHRGRLRRPPCPSCSWHRAILSPEGGWMDAALYPGDLGGSAIYA